MSAVLEGLRSGQIEYRVYDKGKFHAKTYITHAKLEVVGSQALVGSSNFTKPGLTENIELNVQIQSAREVAQLQDWFEAHWNEAKEITDTVIETVERHTRLYSPFEVYAKALQGQAFFGERRPHFALAGPVGDGGDGTDVFLANRVAAPEGARQEQQRFLNVGRQMEQVHDLRDPRPGHAAEARQVRIVPHVAPPDQFLEPDRQGRQSRYARYIPGRGTRRRLATWVRS